MEGYLLFLRHPVGGPKARYFLSRGYRPEAPGELEATLKAMAVSGRVTATEDTEWGTNYVVLGTEAGVDGDPIRLVTVWIVVGDDAPELVTAYPQGGSGS